MQAAHLWSAAALLSATTSALGQAREWIPSGTVAGADGHVQQSCVYDPDGDGPRRPMLVLAGSMGGVAGTLGRVVAHEDGVWRDISAGLDLQPLFQFNVMLTFDPDGNGPQNELLIVGGLTVGPPSSRALTAWDGNTWQSLDAASGTVHHACVHDFDGDGPQPPKLVVSGQFSSLGGVSVQNVAAWDGQTWAPLGTLQSSAPLASFDPDGDGPVAPQLFSWTSGFRPVIWDGETWNPQPPTQGGALRLISWDPDGSGPMLPKLIAVMGVPLQNVHRLLQWDNVSWTQLPGDINYLFRGIGTYDPDGPGPLPNDLVVFGSFSSVSGQVLRGLARWNGTAWSAFGSGMTGVGYLAPDGAGVETIATYDLNPDDDNPFELVAAGVFAASGTRRLLGVASWNGSVWNRIEGLTDGPVHATESFDFDGEGPSLPETAVGGAFTILDGVEANRVARFRNGTWEPLGQGMNNTVRALKVFDPDGVGPQPPRLYAAGDFSRADGEVARYIARWEDDHWAPVGDGTSNVINALECYDPDGDGPMPRRLIAGGNFSSAGEASAQGIASWDGENWSTVGTSNIFQVNALAVFDVDGDGPLGPRLIAACSTSGPGLPDHGIHQWNGTSWSTLGSTGQGGIGGMAVFDPDGPGPAHQHLFVRRTYTPSLARLWDGASWTDLPIGIGAFQSEGVFNPSPNGTGDPKLFVKTSEGVFSLVNGGWVNEGAVTGGQVPQGIGPMTILKPVDVDGPGGQPPALWLSGYFSSINGQPTGFLAKWETTCLADLDSSGSADVPDIFAFLALWFANSPDADLDGTPGVGVPDIFFFLSLWFAGCD